MKTTEVVVVGAGPSGLATAACLNLLSVPTVVLERDDCMASLWRKRSYDRLHLHLHKMFCQLPHMPHPSTTPTFIPKNDFIQYMDDYASKFGVHPVYRTNVESAHYTPESGKWRVVTRNTESGEVVEYEATYLVVASGENDEMFVPEIPGLETFSGEILHSGQYRSGKVYEGKAMLVVGSGNSGMEIAYDLCNYGANTSIVVRSPIQFLSREIWHLGMILSRFLPVSIVDTLVIFLCYLKFGDMTDKGITRPDKGPFYLKFNTPAYPLIDVGTAEKIKSGEIQVLPAIQSIDGNNVTFTGGKQHPFDGIVFATGFRCTTRKWLKDDSLIGEDGLTKHSYPNHWKGRNGLYCAGLVRRGLYGSAEDAQSIANDISADLQTQRAKITV